MKKQLHSLRELSIKVQLFLLAICTIIVVVLVVFYSYYDTIKNIEISNNEIASQFIIQNKKNVTDYCDQITKIAYNVAYNPSVQGLLTETDISKLIEYNKLTNGYLGNIKDINSGILDILLFNRENEVNLYRLIGKTEKQITDLMYISGNQKIYYSEKKPYKFGATQYNSIMATINIYYSAQNPLNNTDISLGTKIGSVVVVFNADHLNRISGGADKNTLSNLFLVDRNENYLSEKQTTDDKTAAQLFLQSNPIQFDKPQLIILNDQHYSVLASTLPMLGGNIISVVNESEAAAPINQARMKDMIILVIAFSVLSLPFGLVIKNILTPIKRLMDYMVSVKSGNLKNLEKLEIKGYAEIKLMATEFNNMLEQTNNLTDTLVAANAKLYEIELQKKETELAILQSQINPHFLYNTLESIKGMALVKDDNEIFEMTQALGQILRYSLKEEEMVTLSEECNIVKSYIKIQQIRFTDRFSTVYNFQNDILDTRVPKMILQPFVENAIYYGLEPKLSSGLLTLSGESSDDGDLVIKIKDNGAGMGMNQLKNIQEDLSDVKKHHSTELYNRKSGIGIKNVNSRLKLIFGDQYGINIESQLGEGTEIIITIPSGRGKSV